LDPSFSSLELVKILTFCIWKPCQSSIAKNSNCRETCGKTGIIVPEEQRRGHVYADVKRGEEACSANLPLENVIRYRATRG
jgi:hypothetical protein